MRYAISIWSFINESNSIVDLIRFFTDSGYDAISMKPENILHADKAERDAMKSILVEKGLPVTVHARSSIRINELDIIIEFLESNLECISLDPDCRIDPDANFFKTLNVLPVLEHLMSSPKSDNILFGLEDFPLNQRALNNNMSELSLLVECPRFGILLDIGHSNLRTSGSEHSKQGDLEKYLRNIPVPIIELHVHDNDGTGDQHMPPGKGNIDFSLVSETLLGKNFNGISTIEINPRQYNSRADAEKNHAIEGLNFWKKHFEDA